MNPENLLQNSIEGPEINQEEIAEEAFQRADSKDIRTLTKTLPQTLERHGLKKEKLHWVNGTGKVVIDASTYIDILNKAALKFPHEPQGTPDEYDEAMAAKEYAKVSPKSPQTDEDHWWRKGQYE